MRVNFSSKLKSRTDKLEEAASGRRPKLKNIGTTIMMKRMKKNNLQCRQAKMFLRPRLVRRRGPLAVALTIPTQFEITQ